MGYNMKNSPINKGAAAKPSPARKASPMKEPFSLTATLIGAGVSAALGAGTAAISKAQAKKTAKKDKLLATKNEKLSATKEAASTEVGGGSEKIV